MQTSTASTPSTIEKLHDHVGKSVQLQGWVYNRTSKGKLHFVQLRDGTGICQCVVFRGNVPEELFEAVGTAGQESSLILEGKVKEEARAPGGVEVEVSGGRLLQAVQDDEGIALVTGAPGTGKTLVLHCLLERLGDGAVSALLTNSHFPGRIGLLQAVLYDLSLPYEGGEQELRLRLTDALLQTYKRGERTVLLVDEAQHLSVDLLEELRLLGNLEAGQGKALQVVLAGQPALLETLRARREKR